MKYLRNLIWFALLIFCLGACKNEPVSQPAPTVKKSVQSKPAQNDSKNAEIYNKLNLTDNQIKSVEVLEKKFLRAKRKLMREKNWAGPKNRPTRAKHSKTKKKAMNRALGPELSTRYFDLLESKSKSK